MSGTAVMLEVKRPGGKGATDLQRQELARWHDAGAVCAVVRSVDDVRRLLDGPYGIDTHVGRAHASEMVDVGGSWDLRSE